MSTVKPPCETCGHVHVATDTRAVGRFEIGGPYGYVAPEISRDRMFDTRAEAEAALCRWRARQAKRQGGAAEDVTRAFESVAQWAADVTARTTEMALSDQHVPHDHRGHVDHCFRCDLSREEAES